MLLDQGDGLRVQQARADALQDAGDVEQLDVRGQARHQRAEGEDPDADHEHAPTPGRVPCAPGGDQQDREGEGVAGDDPLQRAGVRLEALADRGEGDVDDAHGDQGHEQGCEEAGEQGLAAPRRGRRAVVGDHPAT